MEPGLYTVATPIGNMDDISIRALQVLGEADCVVCEDTRETARLLQHHGLPKKELISYHAQSSQRKEDEIVERLQAGQAVALVSDRGTPGISDPGSRLIARAVTAGVRVVPIPGASAVLAALQGAGVDTRSFVYLGFLPHKKGRQTLFAEIAATDRTVVFYESPHRILKTLESLRAVGRPVVLGRELTKQFEEFMRGSAEELHVELSSRPAIKGEFVVIVSGQ